MFRKLADFEKTWSQESEATLKVLRALTDASLQQAVTPNDRTLGRMAWHLAQTIGEMLARTGLTIAGPADMASVLTTESVQGLNLKVGDEVQLIIKAIHVLPVKE